ncbi:hypothetical protein J23TS9_49770 [Paenibacillus sp. J23TS9]|uniref:hypothetical protein n=1 Tax=Paenibacillus sp. J23TS9 TaxID=2807193 RepID=UPI001B147383|nr:hypothetical protein [Paenibacillus sp. J23TS9]GIP29847.1 hypothetical protein J23TS9_49770 [Paenibacillus sp. J23TS9]
MKPVKTRSVNRPNTSAAQRNQVALISALLFLIAALLSLYVAWQDLRTGGNSEVFI